MKNFEKNIVLIGMRGSGKTAIGKTLAKFLDFKFIDVDQNLESSENEKITEIISKKNWKHFRDLESKYTSEAAGQKKCVISTGGGVILREKNVANLKKNGVIVFIHSPLEHLARRISKNKNRPSLTGKTPTEELKEVWRQREKLYREAADAEVFFNFESF